MDFLSRVLAAMLGRVLADDLRAWFPSLTEFLIDLAVRRLRKHLRERYAEEWRAYLTEIPGETSKLFCAAGFLLAGWRVKEARLEQSPKYFVPLFYQFPLGSFAFVALGIGYRDFTKGSVLAGAIWVILSIASVLICSLQKKSNDDVSASPPAQSNRITSKIR
jgi:hypothetical protein